MASRSAAACRTAQLAWKRVVFATSNTSSNAAWSSALLQQPSSRNNAAPFMIRGPYQQLRGFSDKTGAAAAEESEPSKTAATAEEANNAETPPTEEANKTETRPTEGAAETSEEAAATPPSKEELLEKQVKDLKDHLLRSLAEQENTRKIAQKDVTDARQFAIKSFAKSLLDVADNLQRAMDAVDMDKVDKEKEPVLANLYEGIELTEKGLLKVFTSNGLVKYGKTGEVFDPNKHEALYEYPDPAQTPGTVGQVMKSGYLLHDRVLRPAEVGVIKKADE